MTGFREQGCGVPLTLLHGISSGAASWHKQMALPGYRVLAWDMPGYGESPMLSATPADAGASADALARMGAHIAMGPNWIEACAPRSGKLHGIAIDCNAIPDAAMTLATAALFARGTTRLTNIASWRVKETDRLSAMATELRKVGARVEEGSDFLRIAPPPLLCSPPGGIDT